MVDISKPAELVEMLEKHLGPRVGKPLTRIIVFLASVAFAVACIMIIVAPVIFVIDGFGGHQPKSPGAIPTVQVKAAPLPLEAPAAEPTPPKFVAVAKKTRLPPPVRHHHTEGAPASPVPVDACPPGATVFRDNIVEDNGGAGIAVDPGIPFCASHNQIRRNGGGIKIGEGHGPPTGASPPSPGAAAKPPF